MALPGYALVTLAELKAYLNAGGPAKDAVLEDAIGSASLEIECNGLGGRRGVYRGPVESYTSIATSQAIANGGLTIAGAPDSAGRTMVVRITNNARSITAGTLTIAQASPALSETFDLTAGNELHGVKFFTGTVTATLASCAGMSANDTIEIGTSAGYTELYSPCGYEITPIEWPIQNVAQIHEDWDRVFDADSLLTAGTQYELRNQNSIRRAIARLYSRQDTPWQYGRRVVQARMSSGWNGVARVPKNVKGVCLELAGWYFQHTERKEFGLSSRSDNLGSVTRSGPPMLTTGMMSRLASEWRAESMPTAERGWSEAA